MLGTLSDYSRCTRATPRPRPPAVVAAQKASSVFGGDSPRWECCGRNDWDPADRRYFCSASRVRRSASTARWPGEILMSLIRQRAMRKLRKYRKWIDEESERRKRRNTKRSLIIIDFINYASQWCRVAVDVRNIRALFCTKILAALIPSWFTQIKIILKTLGVNISTMFKEGKKNSSENWWRSWSLK